MSILLKDLLTHSINLVYTTESSAYAPRFVRAINARVPSAHSPPQISLSPSHQSSIVQADISHEELASLSSSDSNGAPLNTGAISSLLTAT